VTNYNLVNDSEDRFEGGKLTDSAGVVFDVVGNTRGPNMQLTVNKGPNGEIPALGAFTLVDDDKLKDGDDVPMPDKSTLAAAMKEAFVTVKFDVGDNNTNVPFQLNVGNPGPGDSQPMRDVNNLIQAHWTSRRPALSRWPCAVLT
jgi:hypothetical protein